MKACDQRCIPLPTASVVPRTLKPDAPHNGLGAFALEKEVATRASCGAICRDTPQGLGDFYGPHRPGIMSWTTKNRNLHGWSGATSCAKSNAAVRNTASFFARFGSEQRSGRAAKDLRGVLLRPEKPAAHALGGGQLRLGCTPCPRPAAHCFEVPLSLQVVLPSRVARARLGFAPGPSARNHPSHPIPSHPIPSHPIPSIHSSPL